MSILQKSILNAHCHMETYSEWEAALRQKAVDHIQTVGLPHRQIEAWKYTPLHTLADQDFRLTKPNTVVASEMAALELPDIPRLVCVDGIIQTQLSTMTNNQIFICSLRHVMCHQPELLERYLNQTSSPNSIGFSETNTALFQDGLFIRIPENYQAEVILFLILTTASNVSSMHHLRNIIVAESGSNLSFLEYHLSFNEAACFTSCINEIFLNKNVRCDWVRHQQLGKQHYHMSETRVEQQQDSTFKHHNIDNGGRLVRHDLQVNLHEPGAKCSLFGLYELQEQQHVDNDTTVFHHASHTASFEHYKGIMHDQSHGVFNGRMVIQQDASRSSIEQKNSNLLLSKQAAIDTKPQLEIYNDDVKAKHGATIGQLDPIALFYLQSRGLDKATAINILLDGFRQEIIDLLPDPTWRTYVEKGFMKEPAYA